MVSVHTSWLFGLLPEALLKGSLVLQSSECFCVPNGRRRVLMLVVLGQNPIPICVKCDERRGGIESKIRRRHQQVFRSRDGEVRQAVLL
jgi:hypothetical protein